ncbi:hypothetical protein PFUGPA_03395 [Plasmodium falciparum Palo Alto/Uganda]|uniref:Uncharacterized protein n=1 Tax=Plasmodium falciparum (isolate Palo Alto / Uganda) TaxID=57270 RepID=W4IXN5_PLAFP|nr:hypothetical protein PFUGPA_03395 [Plasmodium falciparum Palo Alto/Uganda]
MNLKIIILYVIFNLLKIINKNIKIKNLLFLYFFIILFYFIFYFFFCFYNIFLYFLI